MGLIWARQRFLPTRMQSIAANVWQLGEVAEHKTSLELQTLKIR